MRFSAKNLTIQLTILGMFQQTTSVKMGSIPIGFDKNLILNIPDNLGSIQQIKILSYLKREKMNPFWSLSIEAVH